MNDSPSNDINTTDQDETICPFSSHNQEKISIDNADKKHLLLILYNRTTQMFSYLTKALSNSYYLRDKNSTFPFLEKKLTSKIKEESYKPVVCLPTLAGNYCFISQTNIIRAILKHPRLAEGELISEGRQLRVIADALGRFRISKEKQDMKQKRGILAHLLAKPERFLPRMLEVAQELIQKWSHHQNQLVNITSDMREFTIAVYLKSVMNYAGPIAPIVAILEEQIDLLGKRFVYRTPKNFQACFTSLRAELVEFLTQDDGVQAATEYTKKLSEYIDQRLKEIQEQAFSSGLNSATLAGYLAPAPAFIATVYELGKNPRYQSELFAEWGIKQKNEISEMEYIEAEDTLLHAVTHEILRLHPSQPFLFRQVAENLVINDQYFIPKKSQLVINFYHALRDLKTWGSHPNEFRPERFLENMDLYRSPFLVYSAGPNNCTGQFFSRLSIKALIFSLITNLKWQVINQTLNHQFHFALTFAEEVKISIEERR